MTSSRRARPARTAPQRRPQRTTGDHNVFIGWSGGVSHQVASALHKWLPRFHQFVKPWISSQDVRKGSRWQTEIAQQLVAKELAVGIVCLTPENVDEPWILFESGALSTTLGDVCTYLIGMRPADLKPPLGDFQATLAEKDDTLKLILDVNRAIRGPVADAILSANFKVLWAEFAAEIAAIPEPVAKTPERSQPEILDEILDTVRELRRRFSRASGWSREQRPVTITAEGIVSNAPADLVVRGPDGRVRQVFEFEGPSDEIAFENAYRAALAKMDEEARSRTEPIAKVTAKKKK